MSGSTLQSTGGRGSGVRGKGIVADCRRYGRDMEMGSLSSASSREMENAERRGHGLQKEA